MFESFSNKHLKTQRAADFCTCLPQSTMLHHLPSLLGLLQIERGSLEGSKRRETQSGEEEELRCDRGEKARRDGEAKKAPTITMRNVTNRDQQGQTGRKWQKEQRKETIEAG